MRADRHPELTRHRPGQQVRHGDELRELLVCDPAPARDVLVAEVADVRDRPAERRRSETERRREDRQRVAPGFQSGSSRSAIGVCRARQDEEEVREPVQIRHHERPDLHRLRRRDRLALGAAADRPRDVERGGRRGAAGQHEAPELGKVGVEPVAVRLEPVDQRLLDPKPALDVRGHGEVGTEVEELVLDAFEDGPDPIRRVSGEHDPDGCVELVHGAVRGDARIALRDA